jgi:hypothetical protein
LVKLHYKERTLKTCVIENRLIVHKGARQRYNMVAINDNFLGLGPTAFKNMLLNLGAQREGWYNVTWKGQNKKLPIYLISVKHLRYNLFNTRVKPHLEQHLSENNKANDYFVEIDKDCNSSQRLIHTFLSKNPDRKEALKYFKDGNEQVVQEPLISTTDGRLINGNQRLCCYRELLSKDPGKYAHLQTAYVAFLPSNGTYEEERDLEATFQDTKLLGSMFDWVQQGLWLIEQLEDLTVKEIGNIIGKNESDVKAHIHRIQLATEFLESIGKPRYWVMLRDEMNLTQAFKTLQSELAKLKTKDQRNKFKKIAFKWMKDPEAATKGKGTNLHLMIGKLAKNLENIKLKAPKPITPSVKIGDDLDELLAPIIDDTKPSPSLEDDDFIDIDNMGAEDLTDLVIDIDKVAVDRNKAKNEKAYGEKQLKSAVTSLDNIISNWDNIEKKGLISLVNKAIARLNSIKSKL